LKKEGTGISSSLHLNLHSLFSIVVAVHPAVVVAMMSLHLDLFGDLQICKLQPLRLRLLMIGVDMNVIHMLR
jgi:hypothetical protein